MNKQLLLLLIGVVAVSATPIQESSSSQQLAECKGKNCEALQLAECEGKNCEAPQLVQRGEYVNWNSGASKKSLLRQASNVLRQKNSRQQQKYNKAKGQINRVKHWWTGRFAKYWKRLSPAWKKYKRGYYIRCVKYYKKQVKAWQRAKKAIAKWNIHYLKTKKFFVKFRKMSKSQIKAFYQKLRVEKKRRALQKYRQKTGFKGSDRKLLIKKEHLKYQAKLKKLRTFYYSMWHTMQKIKTDYKKIASFTIQNLKSALRCQKSKPRANLQEQGVWAYQRNGYKIRQSLNRDNRAAWNRAAKAFYKVYSCRVKAINKEYKGKK